MDFTDAGLALALEARLERAERATAVPGLGVAIIATLVGVDVAVATGEVADARLAQTLPSQLYFAQAGAAITTHLVLIVAELAALELAVATAELAVAGALAARQKRGLDLAGIAGLYLTAMVTAIPVVLIAVIASFGSAPERVPADRLTGIRRAGTAIAGFSRAVAAATIALREVRVVASLTLLDHAVPTGEHTDARVPGAYSARLLLAASVAAVAVLGPPVVAFLPGAGLHDAVPAGSDHGWAGSVDERVVEDVAILAEPSACVDGQA